MAKTTPCKDRHSAAFYALLRADIERRGLVIPPVFDAQTGECLEGRLRHQIAEEIGLKGYPTIQVGDLSEDERGDLRVALSLRRRLSREQVANQIEWALRKTPWVTDREIARVTGADHKTVASARRRLEAVGDIPQLEKRLGAGGKLFLAQKPMGFSIRGRQKKEVVEALRKLGKNAPTGISSTRKLRRMATNLAREEELRQAVPTVPDHFDLRCQDFRDLDVADEVADCLILDPPWHKNKELRRTLAETAYRLLREGGFCLVYTGHNGVLDFGDVMRTAGFTWRWAITGVNADGVGTIRNNGSVYSLSRQVSVYQKRGRFKTHSLFHDAIFTEVREKDFHPWQQPLSESVAFVRAFSRPGDLICDLTAGTGTVAVAVAMVGGGRRFLGCEIRPELVALARRRVHAVLRPTGGASIPIISSDRA